MALAVRAIPEMTTNAYINLGTDIQIAYKAGDSFDGRTSAERETSTTGMDWVGLYKAGDCNSPNNLMDRHKCHVATRSLPRTEWSGTITFPQSDYQAAGEYEIRYFYGDDPTIEGSSTSPHFTWSGQGYICNTNAGMEGSVFYLNQLDPAWVAYVNNQSGWTTPEDSFPYQPTPDCSCNPRQGTDREKRNCCLRHQNCVPQMDEAIQVCRYYHDHYLTASETNPAVSCNCDRTVGTTAQKELCMEVNAACKRCALDSVMSVTVNVLGTMGIDDPQTALRSVIPGFERGVNL